MAGTTHLESGLGGAHNVKYKKPRGKIHGKRLKRMKIEDNT